MSRRSYRFGDYRIDPALRELWRGNELIALPPQVFDFLTYLIERHDRAVGRDELVAAVWGKTEVSDTLIGQTVLRIRRALGDDAKESRVVRTIPRFGYRWVAPFEVTEHDDVVSAAAIVMPVIAPLAAIDDVPSASPVPLDLIAAKPVKASVKKLALGSLAAAVLVAAGILGVWQYSKHPPAVVSAVRGDESLTSAVLPAGIEPGTEWGWMRLGVMDMVAARLRTLGLPSVPSEDIVTLLNAPAANRSGSLRDATAARLLVTPHVHRVDSLWQVDLDADDGAGQHYAVEAGAPDVARAARDAADKLLIALGRRPADTAVEVVPYALLVKRIDAAVLADDPDAARALIEQASADEQRSPEVRLRLAKIDFRGGRLDAARTRLLGLLDEAPAKTLPILRASILNGLGAVAMRADQPQQADISFGEAIDLLASGGDPAQLGQAYMGRAAAAQDQHRFEAAAADYARARIALRQANDILALIRVAANEGFLDQDQDRPAQALPQLATATEGFKQWGALNEAIFTSIGQISCYLALLDSATAMRLADTATALAERIDNPSTLASLTIVRARALVAVGRLREARYTLERLRSASTDPVSNAAADVVLARVQFDSNNPVAAGDLAAAAVGALTAPGYTHLRTDAWLIAVRAAVRAGNAEKAAALVSAMETGAAQIDEPRAQMFAHLARAEYAHRFIADNKTWRSEFDAARQLAERGAVPAEIAAVARSYADALIADGDLSAAEVEVGRLSRWSELDFGCAVVEAKLYAALGRNEARQAALARARALAGQRSIPADLLVVPISTPAVIH